MSMKETDFVVKTLSTKKTPGPDGFAGKFYQTLKERLLPVLHKNTIE